MWATWGYPQPYRAAVRRMPAASGAAAIAGQAAAHQLPDNPDRGLRRRRCEANRFPVSIGVHPADRTANRAASR
jgi:hypothetical protein